MNSTVYENDETPIYNRKTENQNRERQESKDHFKEQINSIYVEPKASCVIYDDINQCGLDSDITMTDKRWTPDNLLTDALVNTMLIDKVSEKKRRLYFYMQSRVVYKYLSSQIGSESIIKLRRIILEKKSSAKKCGNPILITGSKGEGLDMSGSDIDMMVCQGEALERRLPCEGFTYYSLDYDECPGYVTVKHLGKHRKKPICVYSSEYKNDMIHLLSFGHFYPDYVVHGPAIASSFYGNDIDVVHCLKSPTWPKIAEEWIIRERNFEWPTDDTLSKIVCEGCYIVPISSKNDTLHGKEWRLSFSMAEKELIRSFNHVQILIYGFLKLVLNEIIKKEEGLQNVLCSYFLKTTLFWVIEDTKQELWCPKYTLLCFSICLERLLKYVIEENCPNYFVPINNMFLGKFTSPTKERLVYVLCNLCTQGLNLITRSSTMSNVLRYMKDPYIVFEIKLLEREKEKRETAWLLLELLRMFKTLILFSLKHPKMMVYVSFVKSLLKIPFLKRSATHTFCHLINTNDRRLSNKDKYIYKQLILNLILHRSEMDRVSRHSMLASLFYGIGRFHDCLRIINCALKCLRTRVFHLGHMALNVLPGRLDDTVDIYETLRFYSTMNVQISVESHMCPNELSYIEESMLKTSLYSKYHINNPTEFSFIPEQYFYFIKCLCHLKLENSERYENSFKELTNIKVEGSELEKVQHVLSQLNLHILLQVAKRGETYLYQIFNEGVNTFTLNKKYLTNTMERIGFQGVNPDLASLMKSHR